MLLRGDVDRRNRPSAVVTGTTGESACATLRRWSCCSRPDGARLYVLCQDSEEVRVLDAASYAPIKSIAVGHVPRGFSLSPDGARLFVANSWDDTLSVIDTQTHWRLSATWPVGAEPSSVVEDRAGKHLFVANRISNDVAVLDAQNGAEEKRLAAGRGASYITPSPDGTRLYVTHVYPNPPRATRSATALAGPEITVIDAARAVVVDRMPLHGIAHAFHVAFSADGRLGVAAELHPKNLVPLAHLEHGGAFADTITLFGADVGKPVEVPLDELERYASRPFGVAIAPDKSHLYVTCDGSEIVTVIDMPRLLCIHSQLTAGRSRRTFPPAPTMWLTRIPVGHDPRGMASHARRPQLLVANRLDDTISVIDTHTNRVALDDPSGRPEEISVLRHGEQTFYTARYSFQGQIGCANCHIDSTFDGLTWDLEPDGFGRDIVDNRLHRRRERHRALQVERRQSQPPHRMRSAHREVLLALGKLRRPHAYRSGRSIFAACRRGPIAGSCRTANSRRHRSAARRSSSAPQTSSASRSQRNRCSYCHSGPKGTSQKSFDVGTKKATDNSGLLDTPQLTNIALTAPYLHDGSARTLEEIWTVFNPEDKHGRTNDLTKDELNDLIRVFEDAMKRYRSQG